MTELLISFRMLHEIKIHSNPIFLVCAQTKHYFSTLQPDLYQSLTHMCLSLPADWRRSARREVQHPNLPKIRSSKLKQQAKWNRSPVLMQASHQMLPRKAHTKAIITLGNRSLAQRDPNPTLRRGENPLLMIQSKSHIVIM